ARPRPRPEAESPWAGCENEETAMDREGIRSTVIELLEADLGERFETLSDGQKLREELGLDSVDVVSVVSQIERRFRIRLSQTDLEKLVTVGDMLDLLQAKIAEAAANPPANAPANPAAA
ncbi:MAG TPA: phosphopantetheine-binding protein, partial [Gemmataceae bacterium]|nr:phosphopantetheine-binding protein [Gemmataceae bacterium]